MIETARTGWANSMAATHDVPPAALNLPSGSRVYPRTRNTPYCPSAPLAPRSKPSRRNRYTEPHATSAEPYLLLTESAAMASAATAVAVSAIPTGVVRGDDSFHGVAYTWPRRRRTYSPHHSAKSTAPLLDESAARSHASRTVAARRALSSDDAFAAGSKS